MPNHEKPVFMQAGEYLGGSVRGAIIHDDDLFLKVNRGDAFQDLFYSCLFVVYGNQN
jgi:hypothetical protein